MVTHGQMRTLK